MMKKEIVEKLNYTPGRDLKKLARRTAGNIIPNALSASLIFKNFKKPKNSTVLDVGCRVGVGLEVFQYIGFDVVGVDYVTAYVNECCKKGFKCIDSDSSRIPIEDNSINFIFHRHVLEHLEDRKKNLLEMRRVLAPNGIIWIQVPIDKKEKISKKHLSPIFCIENLEKDIDGLFKKIYFGPTCEYNHIKEHVLSSIAKKVSLKLYSLSSRRIGSYTKFLKKTCFAIYFIGGISPKPQGNELLFIGQK